LRQKIYFFNCFSKTNNPIEKLVHAIEDNFVVSILSKIQVIRIKIGRDMWAPSYENMVSKKTYLKFFDRLYKTIKFRNEPEYPIRMPSVVTSSTSFLFYFLRNLFSCVAACTRRSWNQLLVLVVTKLWYWQSNFNSQQLYYF